MTLSLHRSIFAILLVLAMLPCGPAHAQAPTPKSGGGMKLMEMFQKGDVNQNGKLSREEAAVLSNFDAMDADKNGFLTPQEVATYYKPKV